MVHAVGQPCDEAVVRSQAEVRGGAPATGRWVLAASILGSGITFIDGTVINVVLPVLQRELGASVAEAQWIVESYALMLAALILTGGSLGDRLGRRRVFAIGVALFAVASVWCGLAPHITQLVVARAVQGIGAALLVPGSLALISANFPRERRGQAIGTWSGFTAIAAGIGPVLGGWMVETLSWRWIFFINIPLAAAVLLITWRHVPESRDETAKGSIDWPGAALATLGLGGIVFGLIASSTRGLTDPSVIASLGLGAAALAAFLFVERRAAHPMMPLELFRSRTFAGANLLTFFLYAALGGLLFFLPFNLIRVQGYAPAAAGAALLPFVLTMFLLSRWAGGLVDRYGSKLPLVVGPVLAAIGFLLFALPGAETRSYWTSFFPVVMVMSVGMTISVAPLTTTVMTAIEGRRAGIASGINNAVARTASLLAIAVFGVFMLGVFNRNLADRLRSLPLTPDVRAQLVARSADFVNLKLPERMSDETRAVIEMAIREAFVAGFRLVAFLAGGLAVASALAAWVLIEGKPTRPKPRAATQMATRSMLLAATLVGATGEGAGVWQSHAPLRIAREETGAALIGDSVYVVGGLLFDNPPLQATASVEIYRVSEGYWTFGDPMPVPLDHMAAASVGGRLFVIGGYSADFISRSDVWIYAPPSGWTPGAPLPSARGAGWAVAHEGKIYHFGGTSLAGIATRSTFIYDPVQNEWSQGADMPTAREHLNAVSAGLFIYVIGGRSGASTRVNERYNPATNQWSTMAPMPTARSAMVMAHLDGTIYAAGGEVPMLFAVNEAYDIAGNSWSTVTPMAIPRHGVAAVALGDRFLAPGGGVVQGLAPTTAVDSYVPNLPIGLDEMATSPPGSVLLEPNVPNPFAPRTTLHVVLPAAAWVDLTVCDVAGRVVRRLDGGALPAGRHSIDWDARDDGGRPVSAGVYLVRLAAGPQIANQKVIVAR